MHASSAGGDVAAVRDGGGARLLELLQLALRHQQLVTGLGLGLGAGLWSGLRLGLGLGWGWG